MAEKLEAGHVKFSFFAMKGLVIGLLPFKKYNCRGKLCGEVRKNLDFEGYGHTSPWGAYKMGRIKPLVVGVDFQRLFVC